MHQSVKSSLASRLSNGSGSSGGGGSLLDRIGGGKGKELLPPAGSGSKLHGFGTAPPPNINNANAGVELLSDAPAQGQRKRGGGSKGRFVDSSLNAALGLGGPRRSVVRPVAAQQQSRELLGNEAQSRGFSSNGGSSWGGGRYEQPSQSRAQASVSIMGAARGSTWVRVENLALGTTAEDVVVSWSISALSTCPLLDGNSVETTPQLGPKNQS